MEKQAFFEDIGNIGTSNKRFKFGDYVWSAKKDIIN